MKENLIKFLTDNLIKFKKIWENLKNIKENLNNIKKI